MWIKYNAFALLRPHAQLVGRARRQDDHHPQAWRELLSLLHVGQRHPASQGRWQPRRGPRHRPQGGTVTYTWRIEPHWVEVVRRDLPIAHLPTALVGRTLVHLDDLHARPQVEDDYLIRSLHYVSALDADIHALTGDFMTCSSGEQLDRATRILSHLRPARLATVGVLGNHDFGHAWNQSALAYALTAPLGELSIILLRNDQRNIHRLTVGGLDDLWSHRFAPEQTLGFKAARNNHPGGVNLLIMDGSVRFVTDSVD